MPKIDAILCDLDGTLVDTLHANFLAYAAALAEVGVEVERSKFDLVSAGRNWRQFLPELLSERDNVADPAVVAARKRHLYGDFTDRIAFNEPLWSLISASRTSSKTALVTTASSESVAVVLKDIDRATYFDAVVTGDDVSQHKPHPEAYLLGAEKLGVDPSNCLAIEDSDIGVQSAIAAGMKVMRVTFPVITQS